MAAESIEIQEESKTHVVTEHPQESRLKKIATRIVVVLLALVIIVLVIVLIVTFTRQLHCQETKDSSRNPSSNANVVKFVHISDIHFDQYYDAKVPKDRFCLKRNFRNATFAASFGRVGCDSPRELVESSLDAVIKIASMKQSAEFILITGDAARHKMDKGFSSGSASQRVLENNAAVSQLMGGLFPNIPVFYSLGNNDLPKNYVLPNSTSNWYQELLKLWAPLITCSKCPSSIPRPTTMATLEKSFLEGGYYSASIAGGRMTLLVLNTVYFNVKGSINTTFIQQKAKSHMQWIEDQLKIARQSKKKVILSSHIHPGIDPYNSKPLWLKKYVEAYVKLVAEEYRDVVAGQLYGHIHKDDFQLQVSPQNQSHVGCVLLAPPISPIYRNNPAFRIFSVDRESLALLDYEQYYMDLVLATEFGDSQWNLHYRFSQKYPSKNPNIDGKRIEELNRNLVKSGSKYWKEYIVSRQVLYQPDRFDRFHYYCAMKHVFEDDYRRCMQMYKVTGG